jgi:hypothetical protein
VLVCVCVCVCVCVSLFQGIQEYVEDMFKLEKIEWRHFECKQSSSTEKVEVDLRTSFTSVPYILTIRTIRGEMDGHKIRDPIVAIPETVDITGSCIGRSVLRTPLNPVFFNIRMCNFFHSVCECVSVCVCACVCALNRGNFRFVLFSCA